VGILRSAPGHQVFSCFVEDAKPPKEPPPAIFAYNVITDDEADDMELQEETESVSTTENDENFILRGESAVRPPSDFAAPSVRPPSDSAAPSVRPSSDSTAPSVRPPSDDTAPVGLRGGPRSVRRPKFSHRKTSVRQPFQITQ
jgi:hypothetical protein